MKSEELLQQLKEGVRQLCTSDRWISYLDMQSKFHRYSFGNVLLIAMQRPDASLVAGFHKWHDFGRYVKKGEKGIHILAPMVKKVTEKDGTESRRVFGFKGVCVFDISQTDGQELPLVKPEVLQGDSAEEFYQTALTACPIPVKLVDNLGEIKGVYDGLANTIALNSTVPVNQRAKTLIHEWAHGSLTREQQLALSREDNEVFAESVAYIVSNHFGLDSSEYTFAYIGHWAEGDTTKIDKVMALIQKTAAKVIAAIDGVTVTEAEETDVANS